MAPSTLAYQATNKASQRGFNSTGPRPSALMQALMQKWTDKENRRCMQLMERTGALEAARTALANKKAKEAQASFALDPFSEEAKASRGHAASRPDSRGTSGVWSLGSGRTGASGTSRPASAPYTRSSKAARSRRVFAYDQVHGDERWDMQPTAKLKDKSRDRRYGLIRPSSASIGEGTRNMQAQRPAFGKTNSLRAFYTPVSQH